MLRHDVQSAPHEVIRLEALQIRCQVRGGSADVLHHRVVHIPEGPSGFFHSHGQIIVLAVHKDLLVESTELDEGQASYKKCGA